MTASEPFTTSDLITRQKVSYPGKVLEGIFVNMWSGCWYSVDHHSPSPSQMRTTPAPLRTQCPASLQPCPHSTSLGLCHHGPAWVSSVGQAPGSILAPASIDYIVRLSPGSVLHRPSGPPFIVSSLYHLHLGVPLCQSLHILVWFCTHIFAVRGLTIMSCVV